MLPPQSGHIIKMVDFRVGSDRSVSLRMEITSREIRSNQLRWSILRRILAGYF
jgi:hypothetical protein